MFENFKKKKNFYEDKRSLKVAKHGQFDEFLKTLGLWSNNVTRQVNFDLAKIGGKCQNQTFWMIFKHCVTLGCEKLVYNCCDMGCVIFSTLVPH